MQVAGCALRSCNYRELHIKDFYHKYSGGAGLRLSMVPPAASMQRLVSALRPGGVPAVQRLQFSDCAFSPAAFEHCTQLAAVTLLFFYGCAAAAAGGWEAAMAALLRHMPLLSSLHVEGSFGGELPLCLTTHTQLRCLTFTDTTVQALPAGPYLASLEELFIAEEELEQLPPALTAATALTSLEVHVNFSAPPLPADGLGAVLAHLPRLQSLALTGCGLQDLPAAGWAFMPALTSLDLTGNDLACLPAALSEATSLRQLHLSSNEQMGLSAQQLAALLSRLPLLEKLDLTHMRLKELPAQLQSGKRETSR